MTSNGEQILTWGDEDIFGQVQNDPAQLRYLLARRQVQAETTRLLMTQLLVVVALPAGLAILSFYWPDYKPLTSLVALCIALLDILVIDRAQKAMLADSAKLQEAFDCRVFGLEWNPFIAGTALPGDMIDTRANAFMANHRADSVIGWYPERLAALSPFLGRIAAQELNMLYDEWLRSHYRVLVGLGIIVCVVLFGIMVAVERISLTTILLGVLVPLAPLINWCVREVFRQHDALKRLRATRALNAALWDQALDGRLAPDQAKAAARRVQDVSYIRRSTSPAIFEHLYWIRRAGLERRMLEAADTLMRAASSMPTRRA